MNSIACFFRNVKVFCATICLLSISQFALADHVTVGEGVYFTNGELPPTACSKPPPLPPCLSPLTPSNITAPITDQKPVKPKVTADFNQHPTSSKWWSSLIWPDNTTDGNALFSEPMFPLPLSLKANQSSDPNRKPSLFSRGLEISYVTTPHVDPYHYENPENDLSVQEYHFIHDNNEILLGIAGLEADKTLVSKYSDWTVTASWSDGKRTLETTMGTGLPFVYATVSGGDALITLGLGGKVWKNENGVIGLTTSQGHHFGIFGPSGSTWTETGNKLQSNLGGKNYFSVAVLPDTNKDTFELFRSHAYAFVTDTQVNWEYNQRLSNVAVTFAATTVLKEPGTNQSNVNTPLMALFKHQWTNSPTPNPLANFSYVSPHGALKLVNTSQFMVTFPYQGVLPYLPSIAKDGVDNYSSQTLSKLVQIIQNQTEDMRWQFPCILQNGEEVCSGNGEDTYFAGKTIARIAHLIPVAEAAKNETAKELFLSEVEKRLEHWFRGFNKSGTQQRQVFYYNSDWATLIGYPASFGSDWQLNDQHFHYGYFIMAAAIVAKYDPKWASRDQWGGMVDLLIKNVTHWNRTSKRFPFLRFFDAYAGHSWASGPAPFAAGNNEESSSEDFNYISAVIQWGALTGNDDILNLGVFMYASMSAAAPQYWFNVDSDPEIFPPGFVPPTLGIVWSNGGAYAKFFPGPAETLHGINFLPITPAILYLGKYPEYLNKNITFMLNNHEKSTHTNVWPDIIMNIRALYEPKTSIQTFDNYLAEGNDPKTFKYPYASTDEPMDGESPPHTYHWIHNLNQLGLVDKTVTANIPTYAVFLKKPDPNQNQTNTLRCHVAFNPTDKPQTITFSDQVSLKLEPRSIGSTTTNLVLGYDPLFVAMDSNPNHDFVAELKDDGVDLNFIPKQEASNVKLKYKLKKDGNTQIVDMQKSEIDGWRYAIPLKKGDVLLFNVIYQTKEGNIQKTKQYKHKFNGKQM